jgi:hypothetical protein
MNRQQPTITTRTRPNGLDAAAFAGRVAGRRTVRPATISSPGRRARI